MKNKTTLLGITSLTLLVACSNAESPRANATEVIVTATDTTTESSVTTVTTNETDSSTTDEVHLELPPSTLINRINYEAMVIQAFQIYFGTAYDQRLPTDNVGPLRSGGQIDYSEVFDGFATNHHTTYACANGGTVVYTTSSAPVSFDTGYSYAATNCQYREDIINGRFSVGHSHALIFLKDDYTVSFGSDEKMTAQGSYRRYSAFYHYDPAPDNLTEHWETRSFNYDMRYLGTELKVSNSTSNAWYGYTHRVQFGDQYSWNYKAQVTGGFTMQMQGTDAVVAVSITEDLIQEYLTSASGNSDTVIVPPHVTPPLPRFTEGELRLQAADGSSLTVTMHADDPPNATLETVETEQQFILDWATLDDALILRSKDTEFPAN